jgi:hypothetical protein
MKDCFGHRLQIQKWACYKETIAVVYYSQGWIPLRRFTAVGGEKDAGIEKRADDQCCLSRCAASFVDFLKDLVAGQRLAAASFILAREFA